MWARNYKNCIRCGTTIIPHKGKGYCRKCYHRTNEDLRINRLEINERIAKTQKQRRASKNSIKKQLTPEVLKDLYLIKEMSFGDISRRYNCSRAYILKLCKLYNIQIRNKSKARNLALKNNKLSFCYRIINKSFFKIWTKEMAYVLGLFYADGHLDKHLLHFSLSSKEKDFLKYIRRIFKSNHQILKRKGQKLYTLYIGNIEMVQDLIKLGINPKKSLTIKFPNIPNIYVSHFIRGYFDGDGSIYNKQHNIYQVDIITGSKSFILSIKDRLEKFTNVNSQKIHKHKTSNAYFLRYQSRKDIESIFKYFYDEYTIKNKLYLPRKFLKFQEAINSYKNRKRWTVN